MIKVVHCKKELNHEYIGRPSVLGNRFTHRTGTKAEKIVGTREEAVQLYREWLINELVTGNTEIVSEMNRLFRIAVDGDLNLGCWCAPQLCHGHVIKELLEAMLKKVYL